MASLLQGITDCLAMLVRYRLSHITNGLLMVPNQFVWQGKILWLKGFYQSVQNKYLLNRIHTSAYIFMCLLPIQTSPDCSGWVSLTKTSYQLYNKQHFIQIKSRIHILDNQEVYTWLLRMCKFGLGVKWWQDSTKEQVQSNRKAYGTM